jgi:hypothetical protein
VRSRDCGGNLCTRRWYDFSSVAAQRSFASMAAGAPLGSTLTIVDADGPCEIGEMAPRLINYYFV